ncbi:hypothetical protein PsorP6_001371 [Peronosclerospora sorghi]|uniref:Uncharacterized protein n=1 Tax=Peronosclerospora sorghi TaxID=230839 RepID=A0ACC0WX12_9STRA|nr:hypothetical protein PsorP6_001371 [Peronosclerospora sorghi]
MRLEDQWEVVVYSPQLVGYHHVNPTAPDKLWTSTALVNKSLDGDPANRLLVYTSKYLTIRGRTIRAMLRNFSNMHKQWMVMFKTLPLHGNRKSTWSLFTGIYLTNIVDRERYVKWMFPFQTLISGRLRHETRRLGSHTTAMLMHQLSALQSKGIGILLGVRLGVHTHRILCT